MNLNVHVQQGMLNELLVNLLVNTFSKLSLNEHKLLVNAIFNNTLMKISEHLVNISEY